MDTAFKKDLSHLSWDEVYARQAKRAGLIGAWIEGLRLKPGDRVLEIGAGPGYVSFALAERVGPTGVVYALDRSADALAYLERLQGERGVTQIERIVGDAAVLEPASVQAGSALITMVLHHADDPAAILRNVARCLPAGAPGRDRRISPRRPLLERPAARPSIRARASRDMVSAGRLGGGHLSPANPRTLPALRTT